MKDKILQQMEAIVNETMKCFQSDFFDYDKPRIASAEFKFPAIWIVGESHTHFLELGNYGDTFAQHESVRFAYIRDNNPYRYFLEESLCKRDKWFLITEDGLQAIDCNQAKAAIMDYVTPAVNHWVEQNGPLPENERVKVVIRDITFSKLKELIADCREHGDDSLLDCLKRLKNRARYAADQQVEVVYSGECHNDFTFCDYINGKCGLVGGVIFHGWPESGYKCNGHVQLEKSYGWSIHT